MTDLPIRFAELDDADDPRFAGMIGLYEDSIPERERKSRDAVRAMATSKAHRVVVAQRGKDVIGFFLLYIGDAIALLEYLATAPALRGRGLGARLYEQARRAAGHRPLIVEVESDREACADAALRARRIAFYRRLSCRRIEDLDFILPLPGTGEPPLLDLLVDGAGFDVDEQIETWLREIYRGVYGCAPDDPRLLHMILTRARPARLS